ncbi:ankyrin repeat-containing domain protein [Hypoxylon fuscum]|nr:ankyrin repeat-containing domain protein [Hypoxylon fuscum]
MPPLTFAIRNGEEDVAVFLIQSGADISIEPITEEEKASPSSRISWYTRITDLIFSCVADWSELIVYDELWLLISQSNTWPIWMPAFSVILSRTIFGMYIRSLAAGVIKSLWNNDLGLYLQTEVLFIPTYSMMFIHARRDVTGWASSISSISSWNLRMLLKSFYQSRLWRLECFFIMVGQQLSWSAVQSVYSRIRGKNGSQGTHNTKIYGGSSALHALLAFEGSSEKVACALLEHGLLNPEYVKKSLQVTERPSYYSNSEWGVGIARSEVRTLWAWSLSRGSEQVVSKLLDLGALESGPTLRDHSLQHAASLGHEGVVNILLQKRDKGNNLLDEDTQQALIASASTLDKCLKTEGISEKDRIFYTIIDRVEHIGDHANQSGTAALSYAVANRNVPAVEALLKKGANVNRANRSGKTPLLKLQSGDTAASILAMLLDAGGDINHQDDEGYTILLWHAQQSNTSAVRLLLNNGADPKLRLKDGRTAMQLAARYCMTNMINDLADAGAPIDDAPKSTNTPLILACHCHYERAKALRLLLRKGANPNVIDQEGKTPLHLVCHQPSSSKRDSTSDDYLESMQALVDAGADVNRTYTVLRNDESPVEVTALGIMAANSSGVTRYRALKTLLDAGASPNGFGVDGFGYRGKLAIASVCHRGSRADRSDDEEQGDSDCVELLLSHGADLHYRDAEGMTLWHHAAQGDNFEAARTLLQRDLATDTQDRHGRTALHLACNNRNWMTMENYATWEAAGGYFGEQYGNWHCSIESSITLLCLLAASASVTAQDNCGATSAHIAAKDGNPRIISMLLLHAGSSLIYDFPDIYGRLPFHYAANSGEVTRVLLRYHLQRDVDLDHYYQTLSPPRPTIDSLVNDFTEEIWERILRERYQKEHPDEVISEEDATAPPPWRRDAVNARDKLGNTPLHYAALAGNLDVMRQYFQMPDIDLSAVNNDGESVFDYAATSNRECALALANRLAETESKVPDGLALEQHLPGQLRKAAQRFVDGLQDKYRYGAYILE